MTETGEIIGSAEAAEILGVDRRTLTRMVADGRIEPATKLPARTGAYLFDRAAIEALANADAA